jgi:hypothetical protein
MNMKLCSCVCRVGQRSICRKKFFVQRSVMIKRNRSSMMAGAIVAWVSLTLFAGNLQDQQEPGKGRVQGPCSDYPLIPASRQPLSCWGTVRHARFTSPSRCWITISMDDSASRDVSSSKGNNKKARTDARSEFQICQFQRKSNMQREMKLCRATTEGNSCDA